MLITEAEKMYKVWNKTSRGIWLYNKIPEIILLCEASTDSFFFLLSQRCCLSLFSACTLVYWWVFDNITLENVPNYYVLTLLLDWNESAYEGRINRERFALFTVLDYLAPWMLFFIKSKNRFSEIGGKKKKCKSWSDLVLCRLRMRWTWTVDT